MIRISNLLKQYKTKKVFQIDSFEIQDGIIYGIIGANGSGKSTFMKCLTNLVDYSGEIQYDGLELKSHPEVLKNVGLIIETPAFYNDMSAIQNLKVFLPKHKDATKLLESIGLFEFSNDKVKTYSLGMKQKLAIVLACLKGEKVIILDEPFNGLDIDSVKVVIDLLLEEKNRGKTIIVSSHMPNTINKLCDEIYKISNKKIQRYSKGSKTKKYVFKFSSVDNTEKARKYLQETTRCDVYSLGFDLVVDCGGAQGLKEVLNKLVDFDMVSYEEMSQEMEAID